ncbi:hypothetical protein RCL1_006056 [Eukaryota sp. TZLM3-RCL]
MENVRVIHVLLHSLKNFVIPSSFFKYISSLHELGLSVKAYVYSNHTFLSQYHQSPTLPIPDESGVSLPGFPSDSLSGFSITLDYPISILIPEPFPSGSFLVFEFSLYHHLTGFISVGWHSLSFPTAKSLGSVVLNFIESYLKSPSPLLFFSNPDLSSKLPPLPTQLCLGLKHLVPNDQITRNYFPLLLPIGPFCELPFNKQDKIPTLPNYPNDGLFKINYENAGTFSIIDPNNLKLEDTFKFEIFGLNFNKFDESKLLQSIGSYFSTQNSELTEVPVIIARNVHYGSKIGVINQKCATFELKVKDSLVENDGSIILDIFPNSNIVFEIIYSIQINLKKTEILHRKFKKDVVNETTDVEILQISLGSAFLDINQSKLIAQSNVELPIRSVSFTNRDLTVMSGYLSNITVSVQSNLIGKEIIEENLSNLSNLEESEKELEISSEKDIGNDSRDSEKSSEKSSDHVINHSDYEPDSPIIEPINSPEPYLSETSRAWKAKSLVSKFPTLTVNQSNLIVNMIDFSPDLISSFPSFSLFSFCFLALEWSSSLVVPSKVFIRTFLPEMVPLVTPSLSLINQSNLGQKSGSKLGHNQINSKKSPYILTPSCQNIGGKISSFGFEISGKIPHESNQSFMIFERFLSSNDVIIELFNAETLSSIGVCLVNFSELLSKSQNNLKISLEFPIMPSCFDLNPSKCLGFLHLSVARSLGKSRKVHDLVEINQSFNFEPITSSLSLSRPPVIVQSNLIDQPLLVNFGQPHPIEFLIKVSSHQSVMLKILIDSYDCPGLLKFSSQNFAKHLRALHAPLHSLPALEDDVIYSDSQGNSFLFLDCRETVVISLYFILNNLKYLYFNSFEETCMTPASNDSWPVPQYLSSNFGINHPKIINSFIKIYSGDVQIFEQNFKIKVRPPLLTHRIACELNQNLEINLPSYQNELISSHKLFSSFDCSIIQSKQSEKNLNLKIQKPCPGFATVLTTYDQNLTTKLIFFDCLDLEFICFKVLRILLINQF